MECAAVRTQERPRRPDQDGPDPARLLAELPDAVIVVEGDGTVNWGNPAAEAVFGRTVAADKGMSGLDLVHPEDLELVLRSLESIQINELMQLLAFEKGHPGYNLLAR